MNTRALNVLNLFLAPNKFRRWLFVFVIGLVTLASYWALEIIRTQHDAGIRMTRTRPDYFVENFNFVKMLPNGQCKYRIVGTELIHYPFDDHADVSLPVLTNLDPDQLPLTIRSERATIKNRAGKTEDEVHLYDKVIFNRPKTIKAEHLQLKTDYLLAYPDRHTAETNFPVEIRTSSTVTSGVGMRANNATQEIQILKNVYSVILPHNEQKTTVTNE